MNAVPKEKMTAEEFVVWAEAQQGRYELMDGEVYAQAAERLAHAKMKLSVAFALTDAVQRAGAPCHVLPDGMAVRVDASTVFEPDAQLYCGPELASDTLLIREPMIVVEVLSPSTGRNDALGKLEGYFLIPSVVHYLIIDPDKPLVIHHRRGEGRDILTRVHHEGEIALDPPGLTLPMSSLYGAL
ncbi:Uma2 family endonuclease [Methylosinus sp. Sm6]|uniref:Uma2 family endonuclease n=1 Tax=Methylosinus sp. Sm6 TaxID=2866948 RepID=UPI001C990D69|nr:Uma2 family endonuclease [Methylosinus sp. Sm6]MBY6241128.1 Uma2 family endonuclease [Methylosinus sp. Sm6]